MTHSDFESDRRWKLPPLILHPFSDAGGPQRLAQSSRAGLMIEGLLPRGESSLDELERTLLDGRLCEIRMLYYVGKDLARWTEQCADFACRQAGLEGLSAQSFAGLLVDDPPGPVRDKLVSWGVVDHRAIFSRALGIHAVFSEAPTAPSLNPNFIRNYFKFADHLYECLRNQSADVRITSANFDFELYASGEYSRLLERQWAEADS